MLRLILLLLSFWAAPIMAQHPYYLEQLAKARISMTEGKWQEASQQLEMAAFGLMDQPAQLAEIFVRWSLVASQRQNETLASEKAERARQFLASPMEKPESISQSEWNSFLTFQGLASEPEKTRPPTEALDPGKTPPPAQVPPDKRAQATPPDSDAQKPAIRAKRPTPTGSPEPLKLKEEEVRTAPEDISQKYELLDLYLDQNRLGKARRLLKELGKEDTDQALYAERYAQLFYLKKFYRTVIEAFEKMPGISEKTRYYLGLSFLDSGDPEKAQEVLRPIDRVQFPDLPKIDEKINQLLSKGAAVPVLRPVPSKDPLPADVETAIAQLTALIKKGRWDDVRMVLPEARVAWPNNSGILYFLGRLHLANEAPKLAAQVFYRLASNGFKDREIFFYGGRANFLNGDYALAEYMFKRAVAAGTHFGADIEAMRVVYRKRKAVARNE